MKSDRQAGGYRQEAGISIHALTWRATIGVILLLTVILFQFTLSRGERHQPDQQKHQSQEFQSTLLRKERPYYTVIMQTNCIYIVIFLLPFLNIPTLSIQKNPLNMVRPSYENYNSLYFAPFNSNYDVSSLEALTSVQSPISNSSTRFRYT